MQRNVRKQIEIQNEIKRAQNQFVHWNRSFTTLTFNCEHWAWKCSFIRRLFVYFLYKLATEHCEHTRFAIPLVDRWLNFRTKFHTTISINGSSFHKCTPKGNNKCGKCFSIQHNFFSPFWFFWNTIDRNTVWTSIWSLVCNYGICCSFFPTRNNNCGRLFIWKLELSYLLAQCQKLFWWPNA